MVDFSLIASNPFYLATLGLAFIGWIITFAGSIAAGLKGGLWFAIIFELFLILGIGTAIASDSIKHYRFVILTFLGVSVIYLTNIANTFINGAISELQAIAAGSIFLSIVTFIWIFSFGSEEGSTITNSINSLSINKAIRNTGHDHGFPPSGPIAMMPTSIHDSGNQGNQGIQGNQGNQGSHTVSVSPNADYAYKAKALYDYQANPDDQNELSFTKGEILDIVDNKGKWWQAKKADGSVGIAPSNYLQII